MTAMETGSLMNNLYSRMTEGAPTPKIGMGATVLAWTDRYAGTIVNVGLDGSITVQEDHAVRSDSNGMSDCQSYTYSRNPEGRLFTFNPVRRGKAKGLLRENGRKDGYAVRIGERLKYHDFSF